MSHSPTALWISFLKLSASYRYIYTDHINLSSFELVCDICYAAKKYMLPALVEECTKFLWRDLYPRNACRAYEFAQLFEENALMDKGLQVSAVVILSRKVQHFPVALSGNIIAFMKNSPNQIAPIKSNHDLSRRKMDIFSGKYFLRERSTKVPFRLISKVKIKEMS